MFQLKNMAMANNHKSDAWIDSSDFYFKFLEINFSWGFINEKFRNFQELEFDVAFFFVFQKPISFQNMRFELKGKVRWIKISSTPDLTWRSYAVVEEEQNWSFWKVAKSVIWSKLNVKDTKIMLAPVCCTSRILWSHFARPKCRILPGFSLIEYFHLGPICLSSCHGFQPRIRLLNYPFPELVSSNAWWRISEPLVR